MGKYLLGLGRVVDIVGTCSKEVLVRLKGELGRHAISSRQDDKRCQLRQEMAVDHG